jgi:uncharacterized membrane protein HdeD (DUF308 family)
MRPMKAATLIVAGLSLLAGVAMVFGTFTSKYDPSQGTMAFAGAIIFGASLIAIAITQSNP